MAYFALYIYSLIQKNGYTFASVYSTKCVTVFLKQTLITPISQLCPKSMQGNPLPSSLPNRHVGQNEFAGGKILKKH